MGPHPSESHGYRNLTGLTFRVTISASCDTRKGDGFDTMLFCKIQCRTIARGQNVALPILATFPNRTNRMNDELGRNQVGFGDAGFALRTVADFEAFIQQARTSRPMNRGHRRHHRRTLLRWQQ